VLYNESEASEIFNLIENFSRDSEDSSLNAIEENDEYNVFDEDNLACKKLNQMY